MEIIFNKDLYSKKYNLIFYNSTKNGMTTIIQSTNWIWTDIDDIPQDAKVMAVIREPFDRFISSFLQTKRNYKGTRYKKNIFTVRDVNHDTLQEIFTSEPKDQVIRYIEELEKNGDFDSHQLSQTYYFNNDDHKRNFNNISVFLNFDNLQKDFHSKIDKKVILGEYNKSPSNQKKQFHDLFFPHKERIVDLYKEDFEFYERLLKDKKI